ncbi:MAG: phosphoglucosamine mutase [Acidobacteria bacterium]|nr:phosphoglucosamine mutase [Acidobacteriota bacterium]
MRAIPTLKISISGVRGIVGDSLSPMMLVRFAEAFGTYIGSGAVVVGRDTRTSGEMVRQAVHAGLLSSGCRVIDLEICPVPTVQLAVRHAHAHGGIAITASHNPADWNALKFIGADGLFLDAGQARELLDIYHQGEYVKVAGTEMRGVERMTNALDLHIKTILDAVGPLPAGQRRLRVALDSCNGAGALLAPRLLDALGVDVVPINVTPDGLFPRAAEPLPENLGALCDVVVTNHCDVGFAQDMDADRLAVVSERGEPIGEDYTLVLATWWVLAQMTLGSDPISGTGPVVVANLATSLALDDLAARFGSRVVRSKIGEANVTDRMKIVGAIIGGEGNGGVIYPRINFARDSHVGMALILHLLAQSGRSVSSLMADLPRYSMVKERLACPSNKIPEVLRAIRAAFGHLPIDARDGIRVTLSDGWFLVRGSNTEPIIRVVAEATSDAAVGRIIDDVFGRVSRIVGAG